MDQSSSAESSFSDLSEPSNHEMETSIDFSKLEEIIEKPKNRFQKTITFTKFDTSNSKKILNNHNFKVCNDLNLYENQSLHRDLQKFGLSLNKKTSISEFCLLKEIIWSLNIKRQLLFKLDVKSNKYVVSTDYAHASLNPKTLNFYLEQYLEPINLIHQLKIQQKQFQNDYLSLSNTIINYSMCINNLLDEVRRKISNQEHNIIQAENKPNVSLISFKIQMQPTFEFLKSLWTVHQSALLDYKNYPSHICASYMLASLLKCVKEDPKLANLAFVFYLRCLKSYITIIDIWLSNGILEDKKKEFIIEVENVVDGKHSPIKRLIDSQTEIDEKIKSLITNDSILNMLFEFSQKINWSFHIIRSCGRLQELQMSEKHQTFYEFLYESVLKEIRRYLECPIDTPPEAEVAKETLIPSKIFEDNLPLICFEQVLMPDQMNFDKKTSELDLFKLLNTSQVVLPLKFIMKNCLSNLLEEKVSLADNYALEIFKEELQIEQQFELLRKIYLQESFNCIEFLYRNMFIRFSEEGTFPNSYYLTASINDIMNLTDFCGVLSIDMGIGFGNKMDIYESFNEITVNYNMRPEIRSVITQEAMQAYNRVFRFLFQLKWALWTLEHLKFPMSYRKNKSPYAKIELQDIVFRRLSIMKFWLIYMIRSIHCFISMHHDHLSSMFVQNLKRIKNVEELIKMHDLFLAGIQKYSFQCEEYKPLLEGVMNVLKLVAVFKDQWNDLCLFENPELISHINDSDIVLKLHNQSGETEESYISNYKVLFDVLNHFIYHKNAKHLVPLLSSIDSIPC